MKTELILHCEGHLNEVKEILAAGNSVNFCDDNENTPLQIAAAHGISDIIELLLKEGAEINQSNNMGFTPVMHAARNGHSEIVKLLVRNGADVCQQNKLGLCLLGLAVASKDEDTVAATLQAVYNKDSFSTSSFISPVHVAALCGNSNIISLLFKHHYDPNSVTLISRVTPLMMAACTNNLSAVSQLLKFGSDCNITNSLKHCALDIAEYKNHKEIKLILASKTDKHCFAKFTAYAVEKDKNLPEHCIIQHLTSYTSNSSRYKHCCSPNIKKSNNKTLSCDLQQMRSPVVHSPLPVISCENEESSQRLHEAVNFSPFSLCKLSTPVTCRSDCHGFIQIQSPLSLSCDKHNDNLFLCSPSPCHFWTPPPHNFGSSSPLMISPRNSPCCLLSCSPKKRRLQKPMKSWWKLISQKFSRMKHCKHKAEMTNMLQVRCKLEDKIVAMLEDNSEVACEEVTAFHSEGVSVPENSSTADTANKVHYSEIQLSTLLEKFDLQEYSTLFHSHEIDMTTFYSLTKDDLEEVGICSPKTQDKFLNLIKNTQNTSSSVS